MREPNPNPAPEVEGVVDAKKLTAWVQCVENIVENDGLVGTGNVKAKIAELARPERPGVGEGKSALREAIETEIDLAIGPCDCEPGLSEGELCDMHKAIGAAIRAVACHPTPEPGSEPLGDVEEEIAAAGSCRADSPASTNPTLESDRPYRCRVLWLIEQDCRAERHRLAASTNGEQEGGEQ